jgi:putative transcriptional regulator
MFNKNFLVNKLVNSLLSKHFEVMVSSGCFDIAARKDYLMLIKSLINVDSMSEDQAQSLRAVSYFLSAYPVVVSVKNNRDFLNDEMIYSRFMLPVVTPELFGALVEENVVPAVQSAKGRHTIPIDAEALRQKRQQMQMSLEQLAEAADISKKALYEIEKKRVNPTEETVRRLENLLGIELRDSYKLQVAERTLVRPKNEFQSKVSKEFVRMGIDNSAVHSAAFEIVGKENFTLITNLSSNSREMSREVFAVKKLSNVFGSKAAFVAKKSREHSVDGVPIVLESELPDIETSKEFDKILKEKSE